MPVKIQISGEFNPRAFAQANAALSGLQKQAAASSAGMAGSFVRAGARMEKLGGQATRMGKTLTRRVTFPVAILGAVAVKSFVDFDDAMTKSTAIMGDLSDKMRAELEENARQVALTTKFSAKEAAESYFYLASAGLSAEQSMAALPVVAKFATAGNFDMALATDLLTDAQSALGLTVKDTAANMKNMGAVSDVLVKANTLANATVEQFSESLTNKGAAALGIVNKGMEEGVALLAAWADQGIKGRIAGNYLNIMLRDLQKAALKAPEAWKKAGIAVYDASGKMRNTADIIRDLEGATEGLTDKQKKLLFAELGFQDKSFGIIATLLGKSDAVAKYERALSKAGGTTEKVANKQMKSAKEQLKLLKDQLIDIGISVGKDLLPMLKELAGAVGGMAKAFSGLSPGMKKFLLYAGLGAAAVGPLLRVSGALLTVTGKLATAIGLRTAATAASTAATTASTSALTAEAAAGRSAAGGVGRVTTMMRTALPVLGLFAAAIKLTDIVAPELDTNPAAKKSGIGYGGKTNAASTAGAERLRNNRIELGLEVSADTSKAEKGIQKAIDKLSGRAAKADPGKPFRQLLRDIEALETLAASDIELGDINAKHTDGQLRSIRDRIQSELGITRKRANRIMASMFKDWRPQRTIVPKVDKATRLAQAKITRLRNAARKDLKFGRVNNTGILNDLSQIIRQLGATSGAAAQARQQLALLSTASRGGAGGRYVIGNNARGGIITEKALSWVGEEGPEAILPLNDPGRSMDILAQTDLLDGGGASSARVPRGGGGTQVVLQGPFIGAPPETWADFVRSHAAEVVDLGLEADQAYSIADARS